MKPLLVGEAPKVSAGGGQTSRSRIVRLMAMESDASFVWRNLFSQPQGKSGKGDAFPMKTARARAARFHFDSDVVMLLGKRVAAAFGAKTDYFEWFDLRGSRAAIVPHPSGINRWWNDPVNVERARAFWRAACTPN